MARSSAQESESDPRPRHTALQLGTSGGAGPLRAGAVGEIARAGHGQVPRVGHGSQSAGLQSAAHAADPQFPAGEFRRNRTVGSRGFGGDAAPGTYFVRGLHDRMRTHLRHPTRWQRSGTVGARGVREPVCTGIAVRHRGPGGRLGRLQEVRRTGSGYDQCRRHDRLRHGVRRSAACSTHRGSRLVPVPRCCRPRSDRPAQRAWCRVSRRESPAGGIAWPRSHGVRAPGEGTGDSRLRAARHADAGLGTGRGDARRGSQSQWRRRG